MSYEQLAYLHLATVVPAFAIGTWLLVRRKGTPSHRALGRVYLLLMGVTALVSLCMPARVVPCAYLAARRGNIREHRSNMVGLYLGGAVGSRCLCVFSWTPAAWLVIGIEEKHHPELVSALSYFSS